MKTMTRKFEQQTNTKATLKKAAMLREAGYTVIEEWECHFKQEKKTNVELQAFLNELEMVEPSTQEMLFMGDEQGRCLSIAKLPCQISLNMLTSRLFTHL